MPDYSNGKIYIVRSPHTEEVYIGSTVSTLSKRMGQHREKYNKWKKGEHHYFTCFKLLDLGDEYIELIEDYPCSNKNQLNRREGEIMRETENCVNKCIAGRTWDEYYADNRDKIIKNVKEYRLNNPDLVKQQDKNKYEKNKESILAKQKERYENNRDIILAKKKEYSQLNKEKIKAYKSKSIVCECGEEINKSHKPRHLKSKKHTDKLLILKN